MAACGGCLCRGCIARWLEWGRVIGEAGEGEGEGSARGMSMRVVEAALTVGSSSGQSEWSMWSMDEVELPSSPLQTVVDAACRRAMAECASIHPGRERGAGECGRCGLSFASVGEVSGCGGGCGRWAECVACVRGLWGRGGLCCDLSESGPSPHSPAWGWSIRRLLSRRRQRSRKLTVPAQLHTDSRASRGRRHPHEGRL